MSIDLEKDKESVFYSCVQDSHEPIMLTDEDGLLVYVNPAWEHTYGYSANEVLGKKPSMIRSPSTSADSYADMWSELKHKKLGSWRGELINVTKDGRQVPVFLTIARYYKNQLPAGFMGIAIDLTAQKHLEEQIAKQDRLATLGEVSGSLAHEIGTPIGVIRGRAEMLLMNSESSEPQRKVLEIILHQADRITSLINTLLRLSHTPDISRLKPVSLPTVLAEVNLLLEQKLKTHSTNLLINCPPDIELLAEENRLEQIFINLALNSLHAIESKEDRSQPGQIQISAGQEKGEILIKVQDNGCGIHPNNLSRIFEPFFTTKPAGKGTGLGLSITFRLVSELGGKVHVDSRVGVGTTFLLRFQPPASLHKQRQNGISY